MVDIYLKPITCIPHGSVNLPGSKSIANRALLLAALAQGESILHNIPDTSEDVILMLDALRLLGIDIQLIKNINNNFSSYVVRGMNGNLGNPQATIFCGNSGTTFRFLTALLALSQGTYVLTGVARMCQRPIDDLVSCLQHFGADINYLKTQLFPPLEIKSFNDTYTPTGKINASTSSQFVTAMLMVLPLLRREITLHISGELISVPYIDTTLKLLSKYGCSITHHNYKMYKIPLISQLCGIEYVVEPDASAASYFLALGAISGNIIIHNLSLSSIQGDKKFAQILQQMGARVTYTDNSIAVSAAKLSAIQVNMQDMPDVAMTLAVLSLFASGKTTIFGISSWAVKETNRLQAMYNELTKLGATVSITHDSITIVPPIQITPNIHIETYNDHRMAMSFALVAAFGVPVTIKDSQCVNKTFMSFFDEFKRVCY